MKWILRVLMPEICYICEKEVETQGICIACWQKLTFITQPYCIICGTPFEFLIEQNSMCAQCIQKEPMFDLNRSALKYDKYSKKLIMHYKNKNAMYLQNFFVNLLRNTIQPYINQIDFITPVPIHYWRTIWRGYNQSSLLAQELAKLVKKPCIDDLLLKTKFSKSQSNFNRQDRFENVKQTFEFNATYENKIKNRNMLLLDDVKTTGATLSECASVLKKAGAKQVYTLTIAQTIK
ncbi:MAG: ComF family protein [Alphaproteobacteria bacterium]|nr:MAG: ComF family protein [Alphaproteobacteria bacterium]